VVAQDDRDRQVTSAANSYTAKLRDALAELQWYVSREKNLADRADDWRTWAKHLSEDLKPIYEVLDALSSGPNGEAKYTMADLELFCQRAALAAIEQYEPALRRIIAASDQFVKDTGLKHGDLITDAVEAARPLLLDASPSATGTLQSTEERHG
jgi:hypothetical protein